MSLWPKIPSPLGWLPVVSSDGLLSTGGTAYAITPGSVTNPLGLLPILIPFRLPRSVVATSLFVQNGSAVAGNIDLGIYAISDVKDITGNNPTCVKLVGTGFTAQAGTSVAQVISITATEFGPGLFYFGLAYSSSSARFLCQTWPTPTGGAVFFPEFLGIQYINGSGLTPGGALPATVVLNTPGSSGVADIPIIGMLTRSFL